MKITVETGTFADAVAAAAKFSNPKETLYSGVMVQWRSNRVDEGLMVEATNGDVTFRRSVKPKDITFDADDRRQLFFPAKLAAKLLPKFPLGADSYLEIEVVDQECTMTCGRVKVKLNLLDPETFPHIPVYGTDDLGHVEGLASRLKQVSFAADKEGIKSGLHITGSHIVCVSTGLLARADLVVPVSQPLTLPIKQLGSILRSTDDIGIAERDGKFILQTDVDTQVITTVLLDPFPNVDQFQAIRKEHLKSRIRFSKQAMKDALGRMVALADEGKLPRLRMWFREERIDLQMHVPEVGEINDYIDAECETPSDVRYSMTPQYVIDILSVWPTSDLLVEFHGDSAFKPFCCEHKGLFLMWMGFNDPT